MNMMRKGQIKGIIKGDVKGQGEFIENLFQITAWSFPLRRFPWPRLFLCNRTHWSPPKNMPVGLSSPPLLTVASGAYDDVLILRAAGDACFLLDQGGYRAKVYKRLPSERGTKESALVGPCNFLWKSRSTRMQWDSGHGKSNWPSVKKVFEVVEKRMKLTMSTWGSAGKCYRAPFR